MAVMFAWRSTATPRQWKLRSRVLVILAICCTEAEPDEQPRLAAGSLRASPKAPRKARMAAAARTKERIGPAMRIAYEGNKRARRFRDGALIFSRRDLWSRYASSSGSI